MSGKMSVQAVMVHALVFALVVHVLRHTVVEKFALPPSAIKPMRMYATPADFYNQMRSLASTTVVKETDAYKAEIRSPKVTQEQLTKLQTRIKQRIELLTSAITSLTTRVQPYRKKDIEPKNINNVNAWVADIDKKNAEIILYTEVQTLIKLRKNQLLTAANTVSSSISGSISN
jgi:hypothetical protein